MPDLSHVEAWVFDLDNTLYPAECNLFRQIDARMCAFIESRLTVDAATARRLQKEFYVAYGTTLAGLMREHQVPAQDFLDYVHDIDLSVVPENRTLARRLVDLPGRKFIFTNGSVAHAERVIGRLGLAGVFDSIFDIHAADYLPKPHRPTYEKFLGRHAVSAAAAAMFEDIAHNLEVPHALGMTTVLVASAADWIADEPTGKRPALPGDRHDHVHHVTDDLTAFLSAVRTAR
ncbi:MAG: pyrimidine 5'-nucleotidase [Parvularculaceae bacterium]|jgi:putative hydrolase of the HAD superfamily|nr:pyrimidine 5'-nucleotidase [Parvularculaceae bacterium]